MGGAQNTDYKKGGKKKIYRKEFERNMKETMTLLTFLEEEKKKEEKKESEEERTALIIPEVFLT